MYRQKRMFCERLIFVPQHEILAYPDAAYGPSARELRKGKGEITSMNKFSKVIAIICSLVMAAALGAVSVFAEPVSNAAQDYDHVIHINIDSNGNLTKRAEASSTTPQVPASTEPTTSETTTTETTAEVPTTQPAPTTQPSKQSTPKRSIANTGDAGLAAAASVAAVAAAAFVISKRK